MTKTLMFKLMKGRSSIKPALNIHRFWNQQDTRELRRDRNRLYFLLREVQDIVTLLDPKTQEFYRKYSDKYPSAMKKMVLSLDSVRDFLQRALLETHNDNRCFADCKNMYFCALNLGHKQGHEESGLGPW